MEVLLALLSDQDYPKSDKLGQYYVIPREFLTEYAENGIVYAVFPEK